TATSDDHLEQQIEDASYIPSEEEVKELSSRLSAANAIVLRLEAELRLIMAEVPRHLVDERRKALDRIALYRRALAPQKRIPVEILRIVIGLSTPQPLTLSPGTDEPRLLITQVCARWRAVALETPELWSDVILGAVRVNNPLRDREMAKEWLARGKHYLLTLRTWVPNTGYLIGWKWVLDPIKDAILPCATRLKSVILTLPYPQVVEILCLPSSTLPVLEDFDITTGYRTWDHGSEQDKKLTLFQSPCVLRRIKLEIPGYHDLQMLSLPWSQLTSVQLFTNPVPVDTALMILQSCSILERFSVRLEENAAINEQRPDHTTSHVSLPHLRFIKLVLSGAAGLENFLMPLSLRGLNNFEVQCPKPLEWLPHLYLSVLEESFPTLERFWIEDTPDLYSWQANSPRPEQDVGIFFEKATRLKEICLLPTILFPQITLDKLAAGKLIPAIEFLQLAVHPDQIEAVLLMLEERHMLANLSRFPRNQVSRILSVNLICLKAGVKPGKAAQCLQNLRKNGMAVEIRGFT
ncbi:hypothetical protein BDQ12DRAFT_680462, partial [Crucibulum laeve]